MLLETLAADHFLNLAPEEREKALKEAPKDLRGQLLLDLASRCDHLEELEESLRQTILADEAKVDELAQELTDANAKYDALAEIHHLQVQMLPHQLKLVRLGVDVRSPQL